MESHNVTQRTGPRTDRRPQKATTPATMPLAMEHCRDAVKEWDALATQDRENGGAIGAKARTAVRYAKLLVDNHGASENAMQTLVAERKIIELDNDAVIALLWPEPKSKAKTAKTAPNDGANDVA